MERIEHLQAENEDLRATIAELRQLLDEATAKSQQALEEVLSQQQQLWAEREKELENLLEEKSEVIRDLHLKLQEASKQSSANRAPLPDEQELLAMSDELERERCALEQERRELEEERRLLQEEKETMVQQFKQMEIDMSRERADLARQRNELHRLHNEIRHELEIAQRNALMNQRLQNLQRRHQETSMRQVAVDDDTPSSDADGSLPRPAQQPDPRANKDSGLLRRFFKPK
ncbi:MAG: hypothetical protein RMJ52_11720 [Gemmataceae bacterium]|nr:hypothetical protein [Gemmataceae bacterium]